MLRGREHSFETITIGRRAAGRSRSRSTSRAASRCSRTPWIQWVCILPARARAPRHDEGARAWASRAIEALGLDNGMTHMEWFEQDDGALAIGEIAQRPPGRQPHADDRPRARRRRLPCLGARGRRRRARRAVGREIRGRLRVPARHGARAASAASPASARRTRRSASGSWRRSSRRSARPKSESYEGDGYVVVRARETDAVRAALKTIIETVKVHYAE